MRCFGVCISIDGFYLYWGVRTRIIANYVIKIKLFFFLTRAYRWTGHTHTYIHRLHEKRENLFDCWLLNSSKLTAATTYATNNDSWTTDCQSIKCKNCPNRFRTNRLRWNIISAHVHLHSSVWLTIIIEWPVLSSDLTKSKYFYKRT